MDQNERARYSISMTTRPLRKNEVNGKDYLFVSHDEFMNAVEKNEFVEYEKVHDWMYGTPKKEITDALNNGEVLLIDIDVKGGMAIKSEYPEDTLTVFIKPPSIEELKKRLRARGTESEDKIEKRLQRYELELSKTDEFDIIIMNEDFNKAVRQFATSIDKKGE